MERAIVVCWSHTASATIIAVTWILLRPLGWGASSMSILIYAVTAADYFGVWEFNSKIGKYFLVDPETPCLVEWGTGAYWHGPRSIFGYIGEQHSVFSVNCLHIIVQSFQGI